LNITAFGSKAHVDDVYLVPTSLYTHQRILQLRVAVDDILGVTTLKTMDKLVGKYQYDLEKESATTNIEEVL